MNTGGLPFIIQKIRCVSLPDQRYGAIYLVLKFLVFAHVLVIPDGAVSEYGLYLPDVDVLLDGVSLVGPVPGFHGGSFLVEQRGLPYQGAVGVVDLAGVRGEVNARGFPQSCLLQRPPRGERVGDV